MYLKVKTSIVPLFAGCLAQTKPPTVDIQVPAIVKNGSEAVILDCMYTFEKWNPLAPAEEGLVVKWFFKDQLVYQWIAGDPPQAASVLTGRINPDFTISNEPAYMYRAIQILTPTSDLTGDYHCFVANFNSEAPSVKKRMTVYGKHGKLMPHNNLHINYSLISFTFLT